MPTLTFFKDNPVNIRHHLRKLASYLPYERIYIVNPHSRDDLANLIATLQGQLESLPTKSVTVQPEWAPYDEPFTRDMLIAHVGAWPKASESMVQTFARQGAGDRYKRIQKNVQERDIPFRHVLYTGHVLHARVHNRPSFFGGIKENECWQYILATFNLPPTPEGWIPPDMR